MKPAPLPPIAIRWIKRATLGSAAALMVTSSFLCGYREYRRFTDEDYFGFGFLALGFLSFLAAIAAALAYPLATRFGPTVVHAARRLWAQRTSEQRRRAGLCVGCGYGLRASSGRCPECGRPVPEATNPVEGP